MKYFAAGALVVSCCLVEFTRAQQPVQPVRPSVPPVLVPVQPSAVPVLVPVKPLPPDLKAHLKVVAVVTDKAITVSSITRGEGPPRAYPSGRSDVIVLMKGDKEEILGRIPLADPLELRIVDRVQDPINTGRPGGPQISKLRTSSRESVTHISKTQLQLFLPPIDGTKRIEFRRKDDTGELLGSAKLKDFL